MFHVRSFEHIIKHKNQLFEIVKSIRKHEASKKIPKEEIEVSETSEAESFRSRINKTFRKRTEPRYSDDVYIVESVQWQRITLNNGGTLLESEVDDNTTSATINPIDIVNKENRSTLWLEKAGVSQENSDNANRTKDFYHVK